MLPGGIVEKIGPAIAAVIGIIALIVGLAVGLSEDKAGSSTDNGSSSGQFVTKDGVTVKDGNDKVTLGKDGLLIDVDKGDEKVDVSKDGVIVNVDEGDAKVDVAVTGKIQECLEQTAQSEETPSLFDLIGLKLFQDGQIVQFDLKCPGMEDDKIVNVTVGKDGTIVGVNA